MANRPISPDKTRDGRLHAVSPIWFGFTVSFHIILPASAHRPQGAAPGDWAPGRSRALRVTRSRPTTLADRLSRPFSVQSALAALFDESEHGSASRRGSAFLD